MSFFIMSGNIFDYGLKPNEIAVFAYLCSCAENKTYECFPSVNKIANACGMGASTVRAVIHTLEGKGLIRIKPRYNPIPDSDKRRQTSNLYVVSLLKKCRQEERELKKLYKSFSVEYRKPEGVPPVNRGQLTIPNITTPHIKNKPFVPKKSCSDVSASGEPDFKNVKDICVNDIRYHYDNEISGCADIVDKALDELWNDRIFDGDIDPIVARKILLKRLNSNIIIKALRCFDIDGTYDINPTSLCEMLHGELLRGD